MPNSCAGSDCAPTHRHLRPPRRGWPPRDGSGRAATPARLFALTARRCDQRRYVVRREWVREEEALPEIRAERLELGELPGILDALGDGLKVQGLAEVQDR